MKVLILGSGVIGVTSAWYLAKAGHEVTVIDRQAGPALETSFANAGQVSFGYTTPWAFPGLFMKALKWMSKPNSPLIFSPKISPAMVKWSLAMLANCNEKKYKRNKSLMVRVSEYSAECLKSLREETGIHYDERMKGTIQLFRDLKQLEAIKKDTDILKEDGIHFEMLNADGCIAIEPGLAHMKDKIVGALRTPQDETGDCKIFTTKLAELAQKEGVKFLYNTDIKQFIKEGDKITGVVTSQGIMHADAYVVAMASFSPFILRDVGLHVPIYPVKGYSITVPIIDKSKAPVSTVIDDIYKVAVTRLGDRIRVGGMAEVSGYEITLKEARLKTLTEALTMMFGEAADLSQKPELWSGLRPVTPDSVPILGGTKYANLFINAGHGTLGWTMAAGCGKFLADVISDKKTDIDPTGLDISRYQKS